MKIKHSGIEVTHDASTQQFHYFWPAKLTSSCGNKSVFQWGQGAALDTEQSHRTLRVQKGCPVDPGWGNLEGTEEYKEGETSDVHGNR